MLLIFETNLSFSLFIRYIAYMETSKDTGLRVNVNGSIGVNKSVFYSRSEVKNVVAKMKASSAYPNSKK